MKCLPLRAAAVLALAVFTQAARAHLGSPDTFVQAQAGPYKFLLAAHPPTVYPGALELDLRLNPEDHITNISASADNGDPILLHIYDAGTAIASLWLNTPETHAIQVVLNGNPYTITLPADATARPHECHSILWGAAFLGIVLLGAGSRLLFRGNRRFGQILIAGAIVCVITMASPLWSLTRSSRSLQKKTRLDPQLTADGQLDFTLVNASESFNDLAPDHGYLVHLFLIRQPQNDVFLHLHPQQIRSGHFIVQLPAMPPGVYQVFADLYHADSRNETVTTTLELPSQQHAVANSNDSSAVLSPISRPASLVAVSQGSPDETLRTQRLHDGYTLQLLTSTTLRPMNPYLFSVALLNPSGQPPADMSLYLGMTAHAVVLRTDSPDQGHRVFAHIHPGGTLPMLMPASADGTMPGMVMPVASNTATIPYGFPVPGRYRLFVQMKHGDRVETGAFDVVVQ